jgi:protein pelota
MQVRSRHRVEDGRERVTVVPDTVDDLWHLAHVVEPGDHVEGDTTRRITRDDDDLRDTGGEREHIHVTIEVESVEFARFANRLRVGGVIVACSREEEVGDHHTLNVEVHDELQVTKHWKPDQTERLEDAAEAADEPDVAVATVEEGRATVHSVAEYGVEERATITGGTGKGSGEYGGDRTALFDELGEVLARLDADAIVLAGPGFTKRDALDHIAETYRDLPDRVRTVDTSAAGERGVHEVLSRGALEDVREETRVAEEASLIDELTRRIAEGHEAAYGPEKVAEAAEFGAVEHLLVLDEALRRERGALAHDDAGREWDVDVDEIITSVERQGGEVTVFSAEFDPGQQLANFGGVAALLRYRID